MTKAFWGYLAVGLIGAILGALLIYGLVTGSDRAQAVPIGPQGNAAVTAAPLATLALAPAATPTRLGTFMSSAAPSAELVAVAIAEGTLTVDVAFGQIAGDYLFEPPILRTAAGDVSPTLGNLKAIRTDLLRLITDGTVTGRLVFPVTEAAGSATLVFNPSRTDASLVSPHVEVPIAWPAP